MAWLWLALAIAIEIGASTALRTAAHHPAGSSALLTVLALAGVVLSYTLMAAALRQHMEVGVAYAIWSGVGTAAIAVIGIVVFGESAGAIKTAAIVLIVAGVAMLQLAPSARTTTTARTPMLPSRPAVVVVRPSSAPSLTEALTQLTTALSRLQPAVRAVASARRQPYAGAPSALFPDRKQAIAATAAQHRPWPAASLRPRTAAAAGARRSPPPPSTSALRDSALPAAAARRT
ncbi:DMT family transporter [Nonomuraea sp. KM90]|uniref:DMT family transporter n=1 Tax=Nonomuraea sp. KM90 TaxID=3457428 RepID=UPI003FCD8F6A